MGIVQYIGSQNPHSEEVTVAGYQNFIINCAPGEVLTLPDAVCNYLVGVEPNWWSPSGGWTPPAAGPQTGYVATVYSAYTVTAQNGIVVADPTSGGSFAVTLLDATTVGGQEITIKHPGTANSVTVTPASGQTIDAVSQFVLNAGQSVTLYSDGTSKWRVIGSSQGGSVALSSVASGGSASSPTSASNGFLPFPSGDATGATDTANINAALARGGNIRPNPLVSNPTYYLSSNSGKALVIGSNTSWDARGCTFNLASGSTGRMLENAACTAAHTGTDGATTVGSNVVTTALGAQAVAGQTLVVAGAGTSGTPLTGLVLSATSTTITIVKLDGVTPMNAGTTVSAAAVSLYTWDQNISVIGGTWNGGSYGGNTNVNQQKIHFRHVENLTFDPEGVSATGVGYLISAADFIGATITGRNLSSTQGGADGIHIDGPVIGLHVPFVSGTTGDDSLSLSGADWPNVGNSCGDIRDVTYGDITTTVLNSRHGILIIPGAGCFVDKVKNVGITDPIMNASSSPAGIEEDTSYATTTGGAYGDIDLGVVAGRLNYSASVNVLVQVRLYLVSATAKRIRVDLSMTEANPSASGSSVEGVRSAGTGGSVDELVIAGDFDASAFSSSTDVNAVVIAGSTFDRIVFDGARMNASANAGSNSMIYLASTVNQIDFNDVKFNSATAGIGGLLSIQAGGVTSVVNVNGGRCIGAKQVIYDGLAGNIAYRFGGGFQTNAQYMVDAAGNGGTKTIRLDGGQTTQTVAYTYGCTLDILGGGFDFNALFARNAAESVRVRGANFYCDISTLVRNYNGDLVYNSNGSLSCGAGLCLSNGSNAAGSWKNLFTGSTY